MSAPRSAALAVAVVAALAAAAPAPGVRWHKRGPLKVWTIHYRAHNGLKRNAYLLLPAWYGPRRNPPIPLVISPHGRGLTGRQNSHIWGALPARGGFAVVNPDGQGRLLDRYSWGSYGQVEDLARMPTIVERALPWLHVDRTRVYAFGGSMGGQETLLLLARHPRLLAGAAVFDAVTDFARQYRTFPKLMCNTVCRRIWKGSLGLNLQKLAREELGGTPWTAPHAYRMRSPLTYVGRIARSCVPLQIWWSSADLIVRDQAAQSGRLFREIRRLNPGAPVTAFSGLWIHTSEMRSTRLLPLALAWFDLLPPRYLERPTDLHVEFPPNFAPWCSRL